MVNVAEFRNFIFFVSSVCGLPRVLAVSIGVKLPHKSWTPPYRTFPILKACEKEDFEDSSPRGYPVCRCEEIKRGVEK